MAEVAFTTGEHTCRSRCDDAHVSTVDPGELERLGSALRLAESALEEALEAAENLGNFDHRFDVPRAIGGAQRARPERNRGGGAGGKPRGESPRPPGGGPRPGGDRGGGAVAGLGAAPAGGGPRGWLASPR